MKYALYFRLKLLALLFSALVLAAIASAFHWPLWLTFLAAVVAGWVVSSLIELADY